MPARVCDACKISSIASKNGGTVNIQSIRAFALHNSNNIKSKDHVVSRSSSPAFLVSDPASAAVVNEDEELLRMSRALYEDLSQSFLEQKDDDHGEEEELLPPVRRALFKQDELVPPRFRHLEKLLAAEALTRLPRQVVLEKDGVVVERIAAQPVDAFCVRTTLKGTALGIAATLLDLKGRLSWDEDLDASGTAELERWGENGALQRHFTKQVGPVAPRSFLVLNVRCDDEGFVRMLHAGYEDEPELHDPRGTPGKQLPQLLLLQQIDENTVEMWQFVHLSLGGWLPMSVVFAGFPSLLVKSTLAWKKFVENVGIEENAAN
jgi:hypothetical protein